MITLVLLTPSQPEAGNTHTKAHWHKHWQVLKINGNLGHHWHKWRCKLKAQAIIIIEFKFTGKLTRIIRMTVTVTTGTGS